jgi:hypothetical protein
MSVFDDQMDDWFANDCQGSPSDYDGAGNIGYWADEPKKPYTPPTSKVRTSAYGRSRSLLAMSKLEEFAEWAIADGFVREETKGEYEVLRLRWPKMQPFIYFKRTGAQHATSQAEGTQLVSRWLRSIKESTAK